jgi:hypothetical protein
VFVFRRIYFRIIAAAGAKQKRKQESFITIVEETGSG